MARQKVAARWMALAVIVLSAAVLAAAALPVLHQGIGAFMSGGGT